jgi:hypothetical protein
MHRGATDPPAAEDLWPLTHTGQRCRAGVHAEQASAVGEMFGQSVRGGVQCLLRPGLGRVADVDDEQPRLVRARQGILDLLGDVDGVAKVVDYGG